MSQKFSVLISDPAWSFSDKLQHSEVPRGAEANYSTMTISQIKQIPVKEISDPEGAILALWVPSSLLQEGLDVMKEWGFSHKQTYIWVKTKKEPLKDIFKNLLKESSISSFISKFTKEYSLNNSLAFGMGRLFRQTHEICLIGINNNKIYKKLSNKSQRSVSFAENLKHSAKPEHLHHSLELMFSDKNINKIELFARRQRSGWMCIGNQSPMTMGEDINLSLQKLISATKKETDDINDIICSYEQGKDKDLFEAWEKISIHQ